MSTDAASAQTGQTTEDMPEGRAFTGKVDFSRFDALDIGADVNSMQWIRRYLGVRQPIGLNIEATRLNNMAGAGEACVRMNALEVPDTLSFDFVSMSHFIEHLQSRDQVIQMLDKATRLARRAIWVSGPYFEADAYIREYGVKFVWGDWEDHSSRYSLGTFIDWLQRQTFGTVTVSLGFPARDSSPDQIVALYERPNIGSHARQGKLEKPQVVFPVPAPQEFLVLITRDPTVDAAAAHRGRHGTPGIPLAEFVGSAADLTARRAWSAP